MHFTTLILDAICVKIAGGQWCKTSFCAPCGRSYKGETFITKKGMYSESLCGGGIRVGVLST